MATSTLASRAREIIPGGANSAQRIAPGSSEIVFVSSKGTELVTADGRHILDFMSAFGPTILGHNDPIVDDAVIRELRRCDNPGFAVTDQEIELAELVRAVMPSIERVLFTNSGSESTFLALRVARATTGRSRIIKFEGAYHGWHDAVMYNCGTPRSEFGTKYKLSSGILPGTADFTSVATWNNTDSVRELLEAAPGEYAAVIVDPILSSAGGIVPDPNFIHELRELTTRHGTLLIFDEVITGFRVALGGYQSLLGVTPDITTFGKAMANGFPIAGIGGRADLMDTFTNAPGGTAYMGGTYNGHPAMVAAAIATITRLRSERVYEHLDSLGKDLRAGLQKVFDSLGVPANVQVHGSIYFPFLLEGEVRDYRDSLRHNGGLLVGYRTKLLEEHDILETPINFKSGKLTHAHTPEDIARLIDATRESLRDTLAEGM